MPAITLTLHAWDMSASIMALCHRLAPCPQADQTSSAPQELPAALNIPCLSIIHKLQAWCMPLASKGSPAIKPSIGGSSSSRGGACRCCRRRGRVVDGQEVEEIGSLVDLYRGRGSRSSSRGGRCRRSSCCAVCTGWARQGHCELGSRSRGGWRGCGGRGWSRGRGGAGRCVVILQTSIGRPGSFFGPATNLAGYGADPIPPKSPKMWALGARSYTVKCFK